MGHRLRSLLGLAIVVGGLLGFTMPASAEEVSMKADGGVMTVPAVLNEAVTLDFVVDSGASTVCITPDILLVLIKSGSVLPEHLGQEKEFTLADGSSATAQTVTLKSVRVGSVLIENVEAAVSPNLDGSLLLGQSYLGKLKTWSVDNSAGVLHIEPPYQKMTFWRANEEFSFVAGSDWEIVEPDEEFYAFKAVDANNAWLSVIEIEESSGASMLEAMARDALGEMQLVGRYTKSIGTTVGIPPKPAVVLQYENAEVEGAACTFRYGGFSYLIICVWEKGVWDGYDGEFSEILDTFQLHWKP
jgi:clan AA aspartic protease (TIGR02281 family)